MLRFVLGLGCSEFGVGISRGRRGRGVRRIDGLEGSVVRNRRERYG
jgi:hypothetical protein